MVGIIYLRFLKTWLLKRYFFNAFNTKLPKTGIRTTLNRNARTKKTAHSIDVAYACQDN